MIRSGLTICTIFLLITLLLSLAACSGYKFTPVHAQVGSLSVFDQTNASLTGQPDIRPVTPVKSGACQVKVLRGRPIGINYRVLGECRATSRKGLISYRDESTNTFKKLQSCACEHGGDALIIDDKQERFHNYAERIDGVIDIFQSPGSGQNVTVQSRVTLTATVIQLEPLE